MFIPFQLSYRRAAGGGGAQAGGRLAWTWLAMPRGVGLGAAAGRNDPPRPPGTLLNGPAPPVLFLGAPAGSFSPCH